MPTTRTRTEAVPDHHVLLIFNNDEDALQFRNWFEEVGYMCFTQWAREQ